MNLDLSRLTRRLGATNEVVYCYVVATVKYADGQFVQTGTAPNFQGGLITLCTCKHQMRAGKSADKWRGIWIAGATGISQGPKGPDRCNYLIYLMQVEQAFPTQRDLWDWLVEYAPEAAQAKRADENCLGDVYVPNAAGGDPYDPDAYLLPCSDHRHLPTAWRYDVSYRGQSHPSALLVGNPAYSFLWSEPRVPVPFQVGRGCKIATLRAAPGSERPSLL